jgi:hypothetical protein
MMLIAEVLREGEKIAYNKGDRVNDSQASLNQERF